MPFALIDKVLGLSVAFAYISLSFFVVVAYGTRGDFCLAVRVMFLFDLFTLGEQFF